LVVSNVVQSKAASLWTVSRPHLGIPFGVIEPLFALADALIIVSAQILGGFLYHFGLNGSGGDTSLHAGLGLVASLTYALTAHSVGLYRLDELLGREREYGRVLASWGLSILVLAVILFLVKLGGEVSRGSVICFGVLGGFGLVLWRRGAKHRLRSAVLGGAIRSRRAILIGSQEELARFAPSDLRIRYGLDEVERILVPSSQLSNLFPGHQDAAIDKMVQRAGTVTAAEVIVLALSWSEPARIERLVDHFRSIPLPVRLLPDRAVSTVLRRQNGALRRSYMVEVQRAPLMPAERLVKRLTDLIIAAIALVALAPLMVAAAAAIKLESKGPVIFRQRRHGFSGRPFMIYKFRTMTVLEDGARVVQAARQDPRVTQVGRILRQSSIDELPQLVNVLRGDMSIVGPRPHAMVHDHEYGKMIANYAFRHHVKPGITGWAQVHGYRGGTPRIELMEQRIALDLWYINHWSLELDTHIILRTCFELFRRRNAY
jgi:Undecaprenyl-phosphate glucose phosphotransferase